MPNKKYTGYSSDEELQEAINNPNANVIFNFDNSYSIEYISDDQNDKVSKKNLNAVETDCKIFEKMLDYCCDNYLSILDLADVTDYILWTKQAVLEAKV
ncbi:hypothetical protein KY333_05460 [Candidatus Woesearchaeota archaeon]|nr:hypothetical protein [Candidatus Woesearchaeota archaeon]